MGERTIEYDDDQDAPPHADSSSTSSCTPEVQATLTSRTNRRGNSLRRELSARNLQRAARFAHEATWGSTPSVVYSPTEDGGHGNFFPASYRRILRNPMWAERLQKAYTASRRIAHSNDRERRELDCANSSDALLMNIFCHPSALHAPAMQALLGLPGRASPHFGVRARVPMRGDHVDRTELDMVLRSEFGDDLLIEAKLSETDFQTARPTLLARYEHFESTFDLGRLAMSNGHFRSYQLLRSALAAQVLQSRFAVVLDARRTDLVDDVFQVYAAVTSSHLRSRLHLITWQEIAACVSRTLRRFLMEKYGIDAAPQRREPT